MCHKATSPGRRLLMAAVVASGIGWGQSVPESPDWRRIGSSEVDLGIASPATGPVEAVWFTPDGGGLFARTRSGRVFLTADFENWVPAPDQTAPAVSEPLASVPRLPEAGSRLVTANGTQVFALGTNLYRSEDGGRSWANLTAYRQSSVIGPGQRSLAVSPNNPEQLVVANDYGVWRTVDGGMSWTGVNDGLPNLMVRRIVSTPQGTAGTRIVVDGVGTVELPPGSRGPWQPVPNLELQREANAKQQASRALGAAITAVALRDDTVYAGSADGRIWVSLDGGRTWPNFAQAGTGAVESLYVDGAEPRIAVAALAGNGARVVRTTNTGLFWDNLTSNLPDAAAHGVTADRATGAIYVATDRGLYYGKTDLENAGLPSVNWVLLSRALPNAPVKDVRLDPAGNQLYVALDGYGVYAAAAPHRLQRLQLVNAADLSRRAAAPGSLISVLGGRVSTAQAGPLRFPVLAASDAQSQLQVPFEAQGASLSLALDTSKGKFTFPLPLEPASPAIFVGADGAPMLLDADTGLMLDAGNAARSNQRIQILATGLGKVRPEWPSGVAAPLSNPPAVAAQVRAFLDRTPVDVTRAVLAPGYVGFYLIELQVPAIVNRGPAELYISADGAESNRVQIFLEP